MKRICTLALLVTLLCSTACARRALDVTFAKIYKGVMTAQLQNRSSRTLAPTKGDESKRIVRAYYGTFGDSTTESSSGGGGGGGNISSGQTPPSPSAGGGNPFAFKVR